MNKQQLIILRDNLIYFKISRSNMSKLEELALECSIEMIERKIRLIEWN